MTTTLLSIPSYRLPKTGANGTVFIKGLRDGVIQRVFHALQQEKIIAIKVEVLALDSTSCKLHPDAHVRNQKADGTQSFMWYPQMTRSLSKCTCQEETVMMHHKEEFSSNTDEEVDAICFEMDDGGSVTLTENDIDRYEILDRNTKEMKCPCCGKSMVSEYDICEVCNWQNDLVQKIHPDLKGGANEMSLNEAIIAFRKGKEVE